MIHDHQSRLFRYNSVSSDDINELLASKVQRNKDYFIKPGACYSWEASVQLEYMLYVNWGSLQLFASSCLGPLAAWPTVWGPPENALRPETESRKTESQMTEWKGPGFESWRWQFFGMKSQLMTVQPLFPDV